MKQKQILITGATGFIGVALCNKIADIGYIVHALYRSENKTKNLQHPNIKLFQGDLGHVDSLKKAIQGCEEVYHLAALANLWSKDKAEFNRVNFHATKTLLQLARKHSVKKMVITSTAGVIGPSGGQIVNETSIRTAPFFGEYEKSKKRAEDYIQSFDGKGMEVVIVNPTRVFGPGALTVSNGVTRMIKLYLEGKFRFIPGKGDRIGNYAFVEDVVNGHLLAMEKGKHKERYILGGVNIVYKAFFEILSSVSGKRFRLFHIPASVIFGMARLMLWRANLFGIAPLLTPDWASKFLSHDWEVSSEKAFSQLGYRITPFNEALEKTIAWMVKEGYLK